MKLTVKVSTLKASLFCAAKGDSRYYLNGVAFQTNHATHSLFIVSTDGHRLSAFREELICTEGEQSADFSIIIPREAIETVVKIAGKAPIVELIPRDDGRYEITGVVFTAIDGVFPDWRRVVPDTCSGETAQFNPDYVSDARKALAAYYGDKKDATYYLSHNGAGVAVMHKGMNDAIVCIMPLRDNVAFENGTNYQGFYKVEN